MIISGIYSMNQELINTKNGLSTGAVDIEIEEYNKNNQPFDKDGSIVMPGDEIILIPRINNLGNECYIRAKIEYYIDNEKFPVIDYIEGNYSSWNKKDDYYYYDSILTQNSSVDLFDKVIIPNLSSEYNGKIVVVNIVVDAIQSKNFDGNWDNVTIKKSINRTYDIDYDGESSVIFENNANHHITLDNGFFDNLGTMLPGDNIVENVKLYNGSKSKNKYYMSIDYDDLTEEEYNLLQNMKLLVKNQNGKIIVNSNLASKDKHVLGTYKSKETDNFVIEVSLPKNIDNDFSKLFTKIKWNFSYEVISEDEITNPITGDFEINISITVFLLSALGLLVVLLIGKKEYENIEK